MWREYPKGVVQSLFDFLFENYFYGVNFHQRVNKERANIFPAQVAVDNSCPHPYFIGDPMPHHSPVTTMFYMIIH